MVRGYVPNRMTQASFHLALWPQGGKKGGEANPQGDEFYVYVTAQMGETPVSDWQSLRW